jgi:hypothetical protein
MTAIAAAGIFVAMLACAPASRAQSVEIHAAAIAGDAARVTAMLDKDPSLVSAADPGGWTPLHFAAQRGHRELAEILLERGADIHAKLRHFGGTPLHVAASTGQAGIAALLLGKGAAANATDDNGWTPLHRAALFGDRSVAELLLARGASVHAWSNTSVTPIEQALERNHAELARFLQARGRVALPFTDEFSGDCEWPVGENESMSFRCDRSAYRLRLKKPGPVHAHRNFGLRATAIRAEVDSSVASGRGLEPGKALLGIGCLSDRWHGYMGILGTDGGWAIMRIEKLDFTPLAGTHTRGPLSGIGRTNRLGIVCARDGAGAILVSFHVNGREAGSATDRRGQASFSGVTLYADTFPGEVLFERFAMRAPAQ